MTSEQKLQNPSPAGVAGVAVQSPDRQSGESEAPRQGAPPAANTGGIAVTNGSAAPASRTAQQAGVLPSPLLTTGATEDFRARWAEVQVGFVDEPRASVQRADELVARVIKQLAETFAAERSRLETQWSRGADVSTEELRVALQRYRSFFERLLST